MHKPLTRDEAVALYKIATKAISYNGCAKGSTCTLFESVMNGTNVVVQVNSFATGRKEYFAELRADLIDNLFEELLVEEDNAIKLK